MDGLSSKQLQVFNFLQSDAQTLAERWFEWAGFRSFLQTPTAR